MPGLLPGVRRHGCVQNLAFFAAVSFHAPHPNFRHAAANLVASHFSRTAEPLDYLPGVLVSAS